MCAPPPPLQLYMYQLSGLAWDLGSTLLLSAGSHHFSPALCRSDCCVRLWAAALVQPLRIFLHCIHTILIPWLANLSIAGASLLGLHHGTHSCGALQVLLPPQHLTQVPPETAVERVRGKLHLYQVHGMEPSGMECREISTLPFIQISNFIT